MWRKRNRYILALKEERDDLREPAKADGDEDQDDHQGQRHTDSNSLLRHRP